MGLRIGFEGFGRLGFFIEGPSLRAWGVGLKGVSRQANGFQPLMGLGFRDGEPEDLELEGCRFRAVSWTPMVSTMDNGGYVGVLLYFLYTTITGWGVHLRYTR